MKAFGVIIVFFLVLFPNIVLAREWASYPQFTPSNAWCESLDWLKKNTPEPFSSPDFYYALYGKYESDYKPYGFAGWPFSSDNVFNLIALWGNNAERVDKLVGAKADTEPISSNTGDTVFYDKFTATANGMATEIRIHCVITGNVKVAVYSDNSGRPGNILSEVNSSTAVVAGWNSIKISPVTIVSGTSYWLGSISDKPCISYAKGGIRNYTGAGYSTFNFPDSERKGGSYGVAAHWDYGYWITRLAHRPPIGNPGIMANRKAVSRFFLTQDESSAISTVEADISRYIIVDYDTAMPLAKYYSFLDYAEINQFDYYDVYIQRSGGKANRVLLYYPEYYRSLMVRLYNFDGSQVIYHEPMVISYDVKVSSEGQTYKEITSQRSFSNYEQAVNYMDSIKKQKPGNYRIVGTNPFISPIPMNALGNYKLVYSSNGSVVVENVGRVSEVKIFEYTRP